jgi:hypothetical protein
MFNRARVDPDRPVEESVLSLPRKAKQKSSTSIRAVIEGVSQEAAEPELDWPVIQPSRQPTPEPAEPIESESDQQVVATQAKAGTISADPSRVLSEPSVPRACHGRRNQGAIRCADSRPAQFRIAGR